jgi:hypothetical protein
MKWSYIRTCNRSCASREDAEDGSVTNYCCSSDCRSPLGSTSQAANNLLLSTHSNFLHRASHPVSVDMTESCVGQFAVFNNVLIVIISHAMFSVSYLHWVLGVEKYVGEGGVLYANVYQ